MSISKESARQVFTSSLPVDLPDKSPKERISLTELIRLCLLEIKDAKRAGHDWQVIASSLEAVAHQTFCQTEMRVNPKSARATYYLLMKNGKTKDKRRKKKESKGDFRKAPVTDSVLSDGNYSGELVPTETIDASSPQSEIEADNPGQKSRKGKKTTNGSAGRFNFPTREGAPALRAFGSTLK